MQNRGQIILFVVPCLGLKSRQMCGGVVLIWFGRLRNVFFLHEKSYFSQKNSNFVRIMELSDRVISALSADLAGIVSSTVNSSCSVHASQETFI